MIVVSVCNGRMGVHRSTEIRQHEIKVKKIENGEIGGMSRWEI